MVYIKGLLTRNAHLKYEVLPIMVCELWLRLKILDMRKLTLRATLGYDNRSLDIPLGNLKSHIHVIQNALVYFLFYFIQ